MRLPSTPIYPAHYSLLSGDVHLPRIVLQLIEVEVSGLNETTLNNVVGVRVVVRTLRICPDVPNFIMPNSERSEVVMGIGSQPQKDSL